MPERKSGRMMEPGRLLLGALLAAGALACASTLVEGEGAGGTLQDVRVERDGDATVVQLIGLEEPVFTAYRQQDPERLVVDLASVQPAELRAPVAVYDGLVEEVSVSPFSQGTGDGSTRVELTLAVEADYVVEPSADGLAIRVAPVTGMAPVPTIEAKKLGEATETAAGRPWTSLASADPATKLVAIDVRKVSGGVVLQLRADGAIESAGSFTLEGPERLVIDLPGLDSAVGRDRIAVGAAQAERLRIGKHDGMVRVVVDGGREARMSTS